MTDDTIYKSYIPEEVINAVPDEIIELFEYQVLAAFEDISMGLPFVGLRYFKYRILPRRLEHRAGYLLSQILITRMIASGKLVIEEVDGDGHTERKVSALKKGK